MTNMTINKISFVLTVTVLLATSQGYARFVDPTPDGQTRTTSSFSGWSLLAAKSKVLTSISALKGYFTNGVRHEVNLPVEEIKGKTTVSAPVTNTNFIQASSKIKALII